MSNEVWVVEYLDMCNDESKIEFYEEYDNALVEFYSGVSDLAYNVYECEVSNAYIDSGVFGDVKSMEYYISECQYVQLYKMSPYKKTNVTPDESLFVRSGYLYILKDDSVTIEHDDRYIRTRTMKWVDGEFKVYSEDEWSVPVSECNIVCDDPELKETVENVIRDIATERLLN